MTYLCSAMTTYIIDSWFIPDEVKDAILHVKHASDLTEIPGTASWLTMVSFLYGISKLVLLHKYHQSLDWFLCVQQVELKPFLLLLRLLSLRFEFSRRGLSGLQSDSCYEHPDGTRPRNKRITSSMSEFKHLMITDLRVLYIWKTYNNILVGKWHTQKLHWSWISLRLY